MHWEVVQRIIFIFYKTNKGSSYVQGMNEVAGPIYHVFANHPDPEERRKLSSFHTSVRMSLAFSE